MKKLIKKIFNRKDNSISGSTEKVSRNERLRRYLGGLLSAGLFFVLNVGGAMASDIPGLPTDQCAADVAAAGANDFQQLLQAQQAQKMQQVNQAAQAAEAQRAQQVGQVVGQAQAGHFNIPGPPVRPLLVNLNTVGVGASIFLICLNGYWGNLPLGVACVTAVTAILNAVKK